MIPIHFGITGHRDLLINEIPAIRAKLTKLINEYKNSYPHSRFLMLTMLAEGADRIAAEVALECGVGIVAISPMPLHEYEKDFTDSNSLLHFHSLWKRATEQIELGNGQNREFNRDEQYANGGDFIAAHSQILIAIWDGFDNGKVGGTAYVVKSKLSGDYLSWGYKRHNASKLSIPNSGPVYHIEANRKENFGVHGLDKAYFPFKSIMSTGVKVIYPESWEERAAESSSKRPGTNLISESEIYLHQIFKRIDQFNQDASTPDLISENEIMRSEESLYRVDLISKGQRKLLRLYGVADSLAVEFQKRTEVHLQGTVIASFAAFATFAFFDQFATVLWAYVSFFVLIVLASGYFKIAKDNNYEDKFYEFRALAEGLRVQISWLVAGISEKVTDNHLEKYTEKIPWLLIAISNNSITANQESNAPHQISLVRTNWVDDQFNYYSDRIYRKENAIKIARIWAYVFLGMALTCVIAIGVFSLRHGGFSNFKMTTGLFGYNLSPYSVLIYGVTFCLTLAGVRTFIAEKRALQDEADQYRRMAQIFKRGRKRLEEIKSKEMKEVLIELGKEALAENGDWLLYQRSKPLEMRWG